jgi:hypothetical protein
LDLIINTEKLPPEFWWHPGHPVRGTEEFYSETALALYRGGARVTIEKDPPYIRDPAASDLSLHLGAERGTVGRPDIVLDCNPRTSFVRRARRRVIWSSLFAISAARLRHAAGASDDTLVCGISQFHIQQLDSTGTDKRTRLVPLGVDKARYSTDGSLRDAYTRSTGRRLALFSSSPDRGLESVRRLVPRLAAEGVDILVSGYPGGAGGVVPTDTMVRHYKTAHYWLHPGLGNELFCLAAAKAQAAGCCPIVRTSGALQETVQCGHRLDSSASVSEWEQFVIDRVREPLPPIAAKHLLSWEAASTVLRGVLEEA